MVARHSCFGDKCLTDGRCGQKTSFGCPFIHGLDNRGLFVMVQEQKKAQLHAKNILQESSKMENGNNLLWLFFISLQPVLTYFFINERMKHSLPTSMKCYCNFISNVFAFCLWHTAVHTICNFTKPNLLNLTFFPVKLTNVSTPVLFFLCLYSFSNCTRQLYPFEPLASSQKFWFESERNKTSFVSWATNPLNLHKYFQCFIWLLLCCFRYFFIQKTFSSFVVCLCARCLLHCPAGQVSHLEQWYEWTELKWVAFSGVDGDLKQSTMCLTACSRFHHTAWIAALKWPTTHSRNPLWGLRVREMLWLSMDGCGVF